MEIMINDVIDKVEQKKCKQTETYINSLLNKKVAFNWSVTLKYKYKENI